MSGSAATLSAIAVITSIGATLWSVNARRPRRRLLVAKAPPLVISVAARSSTTLRSSVAESGLGASVPRSNAGCAVGLRATGVAGSSLATALSELSSAATRVTVGFSVVAVVVEAGLELDSFFFSTGLLVSDDAVVFGASSDFLVSAFSSFLASAFTSLFSVATGFSVPSDFSFAEAGASEVAAELERSTFSAGAPTP